MNQYIWLAPFIYLGVLVSLYLYAPREKRADIQKRMKTHINLLLGLALVIVILAVTAYVKAYGGPRTSPTMLTWVTWIALVGGVGYAVFMAFTPEAPAPPSAFDDKEHDPL